MSRSGYRRQRYYEDSDEYRSSEQNYYRRDYSRSPERKYEDDYKQSRKRKFSNSPEHKNYRSNSSERKWNDREEYTETMSVILKNLDEHITEDTVKTKIFFF